MSEVTSIRLTNYDLENLKTIEQFMINEFGYLPAHMTKTNLIRMSLGHWANYIKDNNPNKTTK